MRRYRIDGKHHYADGDTASPQRYVAMAGEDRNLRSLGYEVYRFGGFELMEKNARDSRAVLEPAHEEKHKVAATREAAGKCRSLAGGPGGSGGRALLA